MEDVCSKVMAVVRREVFGGFAPPQKYNNNNNNNNSNNSNNNNNNNNNNRANTAAAATAAATTSKSKSPSTPKSKSKPKGNNGGNESSSPQPQTRMQVVSDMVNVNDDRAFHDVNLVDWEKSINWGHNTPAPGVPPLMQPMHNGNHRNQKPLPRMGNEELLNNVLDNFINEQFGRDKESSLPYNAKTQKKSAPPKSEISKLFLYRQENDFQHPAASSNIAPLGFSVLQKSLVSNATPLPFSKSIPYLDRLSRESQDLEAEERAKKNDVGSQNANRRVKNEAEKVRRIQMACSGLDMSGGRALKVQSSIMGEGGQVRVNKTSKIANASQILDAQTHVPHPPITLKHAFTKSDLSKSSLRQFQRPLLAKTTVDPSRKWQLCLKKNFYDNGGGDDPEEDDEDDYLKEELLNGDDELILSKNDMNPSTDNIVLLEYLEERPLLTLNKGMSSKIVNYYKGRVKNAPVSRGGGDRPVGGNRRDGADNVDEIEDIRRKVWGEEEDWVCEGPEEGVGNGKGDKGDDEVLEEEEEVVVVGKGDDYKEHNKEHNREQERQQQLQRQQQQRQQSQKPKYDFAQGVTEVLGPQDHGPFIGAIELGETVSGLINNLFIAPVFPHTPNENDFLLTIAPSSEKISTVGDKNAANYIKDVDANALSGDVNVSIRRMPRACFTVGQTQPRIKVPQPKEFGRNFLPNFLKFHIGKRLHQVERRTSGLKINEIQGKLFPTLWEDKHVKSSVIKQQLQKMAYVDDVNEWRKMADLEPLGDLANLLTVEQVCGFESARAGERRLKDLGLGELLDNNQMTIEKISGCLTYLQGYCKAAKRRYEKMKKRARDARNLYQNMEKLDDSRLSLFLVAEKRLKKDYEKAKRRLDVSIFIFEELQLAPWSITNDYIEALRGGSSAAMEITGVGDPSGRTEAFSFVREINSSKIGAAAKKETVNIAGTETDLRKLTNLQMEQMLREFGMDQHRIKKLERWDKVHMVKEMCSRAANEGSGVLTDGLERFARNGQHDPMSEQKAYEERIQHIWRRQINAMTAQDGGEEDEEVRIYDNYYSSEDEEEDNGDVREDVSGERGERKEQGNEGNSMEIDGGGGEEEDGINFEDELAILMDVGDDEAETNVTNMFTGGGVGSINRANRENEIGEERMYQQIMQRQTDAMNLSIFERERANEGAGGGAVGKVKKKVIRKKITETKVDGSQTVRWQFVCNDERLVKDTIEAIRDQALPAEHNYEEDDDNIIGHANFEDNEEDMEVRRRAIGESLTADGGLRVKRKPGRAKKKVNEATWASYNTKPTNNDRANRGPRPAQILAERLQAIIQELKADPKGKWFLTKVANNCVHKRNGVRYGDVIKRAISFREIEVKIGKRDYKDSDGFMKDLHLMRENAIKFNGQNNPVSLDAAKICQMAQELVDGTYVHKGESATSVAATTENLMDDILRDDGDGDGDLPAAKKQKVEV